MEYNKLRNKVNKFYTGGKIQKYKYGDPIQYANLTPGTTIGETQQFGPKTIEWDGTQWIDKGFSNTEETISPAQPEITIPANNDKVERLTSPMMQRQGTASVDPSNLSLKNGQISGGTITQTDGAGNVTNVHAIGQDNRYDKTVQEKTSSKFGQALNGIVQQISGVDFSQNASWRDTGLSEGGAMGMGIAAKAAVGAAQAIDGLAMGDKNFGAQSQAIDSAVHGVSGALMSSGNPYAMAAGAALEGANFLTKAGGQTVQGFDVNIESSGYGNLGHMESKSSRDWGAMIGLGGIFNKGAMERKLAKRNEQARMAMQAAEISEDIKFEQEARMNAVDNVLRNNQIALAGGVDLNQLGA